MNTLKENIYTTCVHLLMNKINEFKLLLSDLTDGAANESKSSAGDKHETGRAMMQIEYEKISRQLKEANSQLEVLHKITPSSNSSKITVGSLVKTDITYFYLSVAIGKIIVDEKTVVVLSPQSPLGQKFIGGALNSIVELNGMRYKIIGIE